ncbi:hypothetical protein [Niveispirillum sp. BGYR6]|uniref:hypothetical protein n=1 Tax=Niveispirillum sp. BGYR6 TaxID=2971249 RepID=UPI0022B94441|nr:hypothetical protein [Niveispirillum sp. BGYR6]MDG5496651.1 hypothetical protein [Niveispirillum sp. BGYR6]
MRMIQKMTGIIGSVVAAVIGYVAFCAVIGTLVPPGPGFLLHGLISLMVAGGIACLLRRTSQPRLALFSTAIVNCLFWLLVAFPVVLSRPSEPLTPPASASATVYTVDVIAVQPSYALVLALFMVIGMALAWPRRTGTTPS